MYPFLMYDYNFNVQPRLNIVEESQPVLTPGWDMDNETEIVRHVASVDVYTKDEGWVEYPVYLKYEDEDLGCIKSARWYHTQKGPYIILDYEYGQRWFGQDGSTSDVNGPLSDIGFRIPVQSSGNQTKQQQNYNREERNDSSKSNTVKIAPFEVSGSDIDFHFAPFVRIENSFLSKYNVYVYLKNGDERKIEFEPDSGFEATLGQFRFAQWCVSDRMGMGRIIDLAFTKGTVRIGSNGKCVETDTVVKDNRSLEPFSPLRYDISVPPTFILTKVNGEEWFEVKVLSKRKNELISIIKSKTPDKDHLKSVYWYKFDDGDVFIVLGFEKGNKWLAHNGLWAKVDPPADTVNIRQKGWSAGGGLDGILADEEIEASIIQDDTGYKIKATTFFGDYLIAVNDLNETGLKSASWHNYDDGTFLLLIYPDKIYLAGEDMGNDENEDEEEEREAKLKYKLIRG